MLAPICVCCFVKIRAFGRRIQAVFRFVAPGWNTPQVLGSLSDEHGLNYDDLDYTVLKRFYVMERTFHNQFETSQNCFPGKPVRLCSRIDWVFEVVTQACKVL
jgi:hypothetical protein